MARRVRYEAVSPWLSADVQANRIASANWGENHPGFCYEFGDQLVGSFIPTEVLERTLFQERFFIAVWQQSEITTFDVSHDPARTFNVRRMLESPGPTDWCDVIRYEIQRETEEGVTYRNPKVATIDEFVDPKDVLYHLGTVLRLPLGHSLEGTAQSVLALPEPVTRVLFEFPHATETGAWPLDTCITVLGNLAHKEYRNTIYGSDTV